MKITDYRNHIIAVLGMLILLVLAYLFENWQDWIRESATTTLENKYFYLRLWSVPIAALLFSGCWLILFRFMIKLNSAVVALIYLLVGLSILFYPTIAMTLHVLTKIGFSVDYFAGSVYFYSSALVAAMGIIGLFLKIRK